MTTVEPFTVKDLNDKVAVPTIRKFRLQKAFPLYLSYERCEHGYRGTGYIAGYLVLYTGELIGSSVNKFASLLVKTEDILNFCDYGLDKCMGSAIINLDADRLNLCIKYAFLRQKRRLKKEPMIVGVSDGKDFKSLHEGYMLVLNSIKIEA